MRQIRFQFDGQMINETDALAQLEIKDENTDNVLLHPGAHRQENVPRKVQFDSAHPDLYLPFFSALSLPSPFLLLYIK